MIEKNPTQIQKVPFHKGTISSDYKLSTYCYGEGKTEKHDDKGYTHRHTHTQREREREREREAIRIIRENEREGNPEIHVIVTAGRRPNQSCSKQPDGR